MKTAVLQVRLDAELKNKADSLFNKMGLNTTSGMRFILQQCVLRDRLPFLETTEEDNPFYNAANQRAIEESLALSKAEKIAGREFTDGEEDDEEDDPFYSELNQTRLKKAIAELEAGKGEVHELIKVGG